MYSPHRRYNRQHRVLAYALLLFSLLGCQQVEPDSPLRAKQGMIDLRSWDTRSLSLQGEWSFYPGRLVDPVQVAATDAAGSQPIQMPGLWRDTATTSSPMDSHGFATYALRILLPDDAPPLSMKMVDAYTAYALYVDGKRLHGAGTLGTSADTSVPGFKRAIFPLPESAVKAHWVVVHISNWHYRAGGLWNHILIGQTDDLFWYYDAATAYSVSLASAIAVIALYHLGLYSQRRRDKSTLYFALFCLAIAVRILATDERYIQQLFPAMTYDWLMRTEFVSFLVAPPALAAFLDSVMPGCFNRLAMRGLQITGIVLALFVVLTSPATFSEWLPLFQVYVVVGCVIGLQVLVRGILKRIQVAWGFLLGFCLLALTVGNDILVSVGVLHTPIFLAGVGLFCLIIIQSYALSLRSAQAFDSITQLTRELETYSADLEQKVKVRTEELEQANTALERLAVLDGLTKIANRRKFDEELAKAWSEHRRRGQALSVLLCDIDSFKAYNDDYGHLQGDEALRQVAQAIETALARPSDLAARFGGEEFAVLLSDTPLEGALEVAEKIRRGVETLHIPHRAAASGELTLSLGAASLLPAEGTAIADLLLRADQALYRAKAGGKNRVEADLA